MRRPYQITGGIVLVLAVLVGWEALQLKFYTHLGPGPGFFPFWLAVVLGGLAVAMIFQATFRPAEPMPPGFFATRAGYLRMGAIVAGLVATTTLLDVFGFRLTMLGVFLFMLCALGRQKLIVTLLVSLAGSFGVFHVFDRWLRVQLPVGFLGF